MARKKKEHAHENHERWLLTYADMITLLVAFFIMLYAMSVMNQHKFEQVALSVRSGFGGNLTHQAPSLLDGEGVNTPRNALSPGGSGNGEKAQINTSWDAKLTAISPSEMTAAGGGKISDLAVMDSTLAALKKAIRQRHLESMLQAHSEERGIVITVLTDKFLFEKGQADLRPQSLYVLDVVARPLQAVPNQIRVEGHTDDLPIHTARFGSNWELSAARATNVLRYFLDHDHLTPGRVSMAGYADTRPVDKNDTEAHRARNRRVDIVVLRQAAADAS
jgi:chemotaxis protein MotB